MLPLLDLSTVLEKPRLSLPMLRLLSSEAQGCKDFLKPSKPCHVGIHWIALDEYSQMSTHLPGFQSSLRFSGSFCGDQISRLITVLSISRMCSTYTNVQLTHVFNWWRFWFVPTWKAKHHFAEEFRKCWNYMYIMHMHMFNWWRFWFEKHNIIFHRTSEKCWKYRWSTLPMLRIYFCHKLKGRKNFWKPSKPCHVGIHRIARAEYSQMSTNLIGFQSFSSLLHHFVLAKFAISSIRVNALMPVAFKSTCRDYLRGISLANLEYFTKHLKESYQ